MFPIDNSFRLFFFEITFNFLNSLILLSLIIFCFFFNNIENKINLAFKEVKGLESHEVEMNDIAKKAIDSYEQLMSLGMNVSDMAAGKVFAEASNMLKIALDASDAKTKAKLQQIDLMLKKARIDQFDNKGTETEAVQATVFDRNDLLKIIKGES